MCDFFQPADVIDSYTRKQAIADGVLVDVTDTAKETGFKYPVAVTQNLWDNWITPNEQAKRYGQDRDGRLWDVLWMCSLASRKSKETLVKFSVIFQNGPGQKNRHNLVLWAICGPGDTLAPVITVMLPEDY